MRFSVAAYRPGLAVAALVAVSTLVGCRSQANIPEPVRPALVAQPQPDSADSGRLYSGDVRARYESALGFRVSGKIQRRLVDVGAHVESGQLLAELDPQDLSLQAASAEATLAAAEADLGVARAERERYLTLLDKHFVSRTAFDAVDNRHKAAEARVNEARAALAVARNQTGYAALRADQAGVITTITAEAGQVVAAGQTVATLARDGEREVEISVPESQVGALQPGVAATIEPWAESGTRLTGSLREISPEADPATRTYRVRVTIGDGSAALKLGQTARVFFGEREAAILQRVPLAALYEKDGRPAVWRVDPKTAQVHLVPVTVAAYREQGVLVATGVAAGDWVVAAGVHKLHEGQTVRPVDAGNHPVKF